MPIARYQIKNAYSLADPELYNAADKNDPEALLEGVAMAGLVGVLRQLGDLAEFAAEIFNNLHEEVTATAARGHGLQERVHQLELEIPSIERAFLSQTCHSTFFPNSGIDWHPNKQTSQNLITTGDLPRFVMDSYEECRGPPRLFLLDKFDVGGAGACLKRYSDPSIYKVEISSYEIENAETQRDKKIRKIKKKGSQWKGGTPLFSPTSHAKLHQLFLEDRVQNGIIEPTHHVKLKKRQNKNPFNSKPGKSYMNQLLLSSPSEGKIVHQVPTRPITSNQSAFETFKDAVSSPFYLSTPSQSPSLSSKVTFRKVPETSEVDEKKIEVDEIGTDYVQNGDDVASEPDNYVDALATMESDVNQGVILEEGKDDENLEIEGRHSDQLSDSQFNFASIVGSKEIPFRPRVSPRGTHIDMNRGVILEEGKDDGNVENEEHQVEFLTPLGSLLLAEHDFEGEEILDSHDSNSLHEEKLNKKEDDNASDIDDADKSGELKVRETREIIVGSVPNDVDANDDNTLSTLEHDTELKGREEDSVDLEKMEKTISVLLPLDANKNEDNSSSTLEEPDEIHQSCIIQGSKESNDLNHDNNDNDNSVSHELELESKSVNHVNDTQKVNLPSQTVLQEEEKSPQGKPIIVSEKLPTNHFDQVKPQLPPLIPEIPPVKLEDAPPLPPLPPMQWRTRKLPEGGQHNFQPVFQPNEGFQVAGPAPLDENKNPDIDHEKFAENSVSPRNDDVATGIRPMKVQRPRSPLIEAVAAHDKTKLRKVSDRAMSQIPKGQENDKLLEQIRTKSYKLKPAVQSRPNVHGPTTNVRIAAILEKANAIRHAFAGSDDEDDDDDNDSWSDSS